MTHDCIIWQTHFTTWEKHLPGKVVFNSFGILSVTLTPLLLVHSFWPDLLQQRDVKLPKESSGLESIFSGFNHMVFKKKKPATKSYQSML